MVEHCRGEGCEEIDWEGWKFIDGLCKKCWVDMVYNKLMGEGEVKLRFDFTGDDTGVVEESE